jgi:serine/threonine protein phosphatase PrpC
MAELYFGLTDTGRQRQNNEDAFIAEPVGGDAFIAACVIDGVGGYEGGEVAAAIAHDAILKRLAQPSSDKIAALKEALISANDRIVQEKRQTAKNDQMACVLTLALIEKGANKFYYAHVGDTRLYLFRDGTLVKITKDQSFVGFLEDSGRLSEEAAMSHPKRNEINKALGFESPLTTPDYIETGESPFLPGDQLLLCSDGLTDMVDREKISKVLGSAESLEGKAFKLIKAANEAGGKDNITVVLVHNTKASQTHTATKPVLVKKSESITDKTVSVASQTSPKPPKRGNPLLFFLLILTLLSLAGFFWQWREKTRIQSEVTPLSSPLASVNGSAEDSLQNSSGRAQLFGMTATDTVLLSKPLVVRADSLHLQGSGQTIIQPDSTKGALVNIYILPSVKYLLFDGLVLQNTIIHVGEENRAALHFNKVRFQNAALSVGTMTRLEDSLFTGSLLVLVQRRDSLPQKKSL